MAAILFKAPLPFLRAAPAPGDGTGTSPAPVVVGRGLAGTVPSPRFAAPLGDVPPLSLSFPLQHTPAQDEHIRSDECAAKSIDPGDTNEGTRGGRKGGEKETLSLHGLCGLCSVASSSAQSFPGPAPGLRWLHSPPPGSHCHSSPSTPRPCCRCPRSPHFQRCQHSPRCQRWLRSTTLGSSYDAGGDPLWSRCGTTLHCSSSQESRCNCCGRWDTRIPRRSRSGLNGGQRSRSPPTGGASLLSGWSAPPPHCPV